MKTVFAIYTQFEPTYEYEESLESLWTKKEDAIKEANSIDNVDWVTIVELKLNTDNMFVPDSTLVIKKPRGIK